VLATALGLVGCTYPEFGFEPVGDGGSGNGGEPAGSGARGGGGGGVAGSAGSTGSFGGSGGSPSSATGHPVGGGGSAGGGGAPVVTVPCKDPSMECAEGESCCFHESSAAQDKCALTGACGGAQFADFSCNTHADCGSGVCCATVDIFSWPLSIKCESACNGSDKLVMCAADAECTDQTCDPFPTSGIDYPGYGWCS
jgi:hypothetical protein